MTELKHLQLVILGIMKDIDELCKENNIEYYLLSGSALGAIRHKGFIPWDDDLDIVIPHYDYDRFVKLCRTKLDSGKYYVQEGLVDWPMIYSKMRLRNTYYDEPGAYGGMNERGIFVDVFRLDNAPDKKWERTIQYVFAKYALCYCLYKRGYGEASTKKKLLMYSSIPLLIKPLRQAVFNQITKYNKRATQWYAIWGLRYNYRQSFYQKQLFSNPVYVQFEDTKLPVPEKYDEMLSQVFGDYLTPPNIKEQVGSHLMNIDFGQY